MTKQYKIEASSTLHHVTLNQVEVSSIKEKIFLKLQEKLTTYYTLGVTPLSQPHD